MDDINDVFGGGLGGSLISLMLSLVVDAHYPTTYHCQ
jgi:hypothetical protein